MKELIYILSQSLQEDPLSKTFTQIICVLLFIGALPGLIHLSSYIHKKIPLLAKAPKNPVLLVLLCLLGAAVSILLSLISWVFSFLCIFLFFVAISPRFEKWTVLSVNPSLLTTIGILGTFVGIYIGLHEFNISNIDGSIPRLLRGLKIAFTTSIVGILGAVLLKIILSHTPSTSPSQKEGEREIFDIFNNIYKTLQDHYEHSKVQYRKIIETTEKNMDMQNKMIQSLYSKINSLENSSVKPVSEVNQALGKIKKNQ